MAAVVGCDGHPGDAPRFDRVVLVTVDTLRADHVGCYGYRRPLTPFMDRLAGWGSRFDRAMASATVTVPSHASMLTGSHPFRTGVVSNRHELDPAIPNVASVLGQMGVETAAFAGAKFLRRIGAGFEVVDAEFRRGAATVDAAIRWLEGLAPETRFFLWVHLYDVHEWYRMRPIQPWLKRARESVDFGGPVARYAYMAELHAWPKPFAADWAYADRRVTTPAQILEIIDHYDARISYADHQMSRLHAALEGRGETLWIVASDHGEGLGGHGYISHPLNLYTEQLRVPLIVAGSAGSVPAREIDAQVRLVDLAPTIVELMGGDAHGVARDGRSLVPLLFGEDAADRLVFAEREPYETWMESYGAVDEEVYAVRDRGHVYIARSQSPDEVYALARDPGETRNLESPPPHLAEFLNETLKARRSPAHRPDVPPDIEAELKSLGYAQ